MRIFDVGAKDGEQVVSGRIATVPNLLSLLRLLALPFVYADLVSGDHLRALLLLIVFTSTDWLDGYVARRFDQVTRVGQLLDPISDRLLFVVVGVGMVVADLLPLWALLLLVVRDALVIGVGSYMLARGARPPPVTRLGKAATFGLMWALPSFVLASVLGDGPADPQPAVQAFAWFAFVVNVVMYYLAAVGYARYVRREAARAT